MSYILFQCNFHSLSLLLGQFCSKSFVWKVPFQSHCRPFHGVWWIPCMHQFQQREHLSKEGVWQHLLPQHQRYTGGTRLQWNQLVHGLKHLPKHYFKIRDRFKHKIKLTGTQTCLRLSLARCRQFKQLLLWLPYSFSEVKLLPHASLCSAKFLSVVINVFAILTRALLSKEGNFS